MKNIVLIIILLVLISIKIYSQQKVIIKGKVIDKETKETIPGANVIEYDANDRVVNGTVTDANGNFVIELKNSSNIVKVSLIGYNTITIKPEVGKNILVELEASEIKIEEVTKIGKASKNPIGLTNISDRDKVTASIKMDLIEMKDAGVLSAADALQGKVSGLDILAASGDPGAGSHIVIRGMSSLGNNKPLIVIDGIPQADPPNYKDFQLSSATAEDIGNLLKIPVQDIKSIEILKDAAATSIYGSRGADGVLLIETYKGRLGKVKFDYNYKFSYNYQPPSIPMLNGDEYIMLQLEEWHNHYGVFQIPKEISYDKDDPDFYNYSANTDWVKAITKDAMTHEHYFSASGGGEKTRYYASVNYINEGGTTINTFSKRFSTRINLDYFLSSKLLFMVQFNYNNNFTRSNFYFADRDMTVRKMAYMKAPNMSIWEYDANGNPTGEYFTPINSYQGDGYTFFNPVAVANLGKNDRKANGIMNSFTLRYTFTDWINLRTTISYQFEGSKSNNFLPYNAVGTDWLAWTVNKAEESNNDNTTINTETQLNFSLPFKSNIHVVSGSLTWITEQNKGSWVNIQSNKIPTVEVKDPAIQAQINWIGNGSWESRALGAAANLNYILLDRYILQSMLRADAYSGFGENYRWGIFKGISFGWRFSNEPFLKNLKFLGESKIRGGWGVSGRRPWDSYARFATYNNSATGHYINNIGIIPTKIQLNNLRWETVTSYDLGIDLNLFKDKIYINGDIYKKITTDILFNRYKIPSSSGYDEMQFFNGGKLENKGWEIMFEYRIIQKSNIRWSINFNTSQNKNIFVDIPDNFNTERSTSIGNGEYPKRLVEGEPIGSFFGFRYLGVYPTDQDAYARDAYGNILYDNEGKPIPMIYKNYVFKGGDAKYEDINHDGRIDLNDVVYLGNSNPDWVGGFGTSFRFKNFDLSCSFHYRLGFDIVNGVAIETEGMNNKNNQSKAVLNRWRVQGQNEPGMLPRAYIDHPANNLGSDRYVEKGDYFRLLNIMLTYRFGKKICDKLNIDQMNLTLSARRLFTITNYSGQDPEVGFDASDPFWIGVDRAQTPPPKIITLSLSVSF